MFRYHDTMYRPNNLVSKPNQWFEITLVKRKIIIIKIRKCFYPTWTKCGPNATHTPVWRQDKRYKRVICMVLIICVHPFFTLITGKLKKSTVLYKWRIFQRSVCQRVRHETNGLRDTVNSTFSFRCPYFYLFIYFLNAFT